MKFEDMQIIQNALNLWVCLVANENSLFDKFIAN